MESSIKFQEKHLKVRKSAFNYDLKTKMDEKLFSHILWNQFLICIGSYKLKLFFMSPECLSTNTLYKNEWFS